LTPDAPAPDLLSLSAVTLGFGGPPVLAEIDFSVRAGEAVVVLGPSGGGKSVLLKTLVGLLRPQAGEVRACGERVDDRPEAELTQLRRKVSYCFQNGALFDSMNVGDNLAYPLREHRSAGEDEIHERVEEALARVGLGGKAGVMPAELSGGMRKRAALARAVITRPEVILYDEPTAGLDPITARQINALMNELKAAPGAAADAPPITTLTVTHDIESALHVGRRVALLQAGKISFSGDWDAAFRSDNALLRAFLQGHTPGVPVAH
jgi:phospholipid/cholesterol/gamma-HCH transport system ATP-binding protein